MKIRTTISSLFFTLMFSVSLLAQESYDVILRGGTIYDGSGNPPVTGDVAINGDKIAALGDIGDASAKLEVNVDGPA